MSNATTLQPLPGFSVTASVVEYHEPPRRGAFESPKASRTSSVLLPKLLRSSVMRVTPAAR